MLDVFSWEQFIDFAIRSVAVCWQSLRFDQKPFGWQVHIKIYFCYTTPRFCFDVGVAARIFVNGLALYPLDNLSASCLSSCFARIILAFIPTSIALDNPDMHAVPSGGPRQNAQAQHSDTALDSSVVSVWLRALSCTPFSRASNRSTMPHGQISPSAYAERSHRKKNVYTYRTAVPRRVIFEV